MTHSQKYSIVQFVEPIKEEYVFSMNRWPLHVTIADVFAVELSESFLEELATSMAAEESLLVKADKKDSFGVGENTIPVTLIQNTAELQSLHDRLIDVLEKCGAVFNSPQFTHSGFLPHSTYQKQAELEIGQQVAIKELSLVDMFVDGDWKRRKVLCNFKIGR